MHATAAILIGGIILGIAVVATVAVLLVRQTRK